MAPTRHPTRALTPKPNKSAHLARKQPAQQAQPTAGMGLNIGAVICRPWRHAQQMSKTLTGDKHMTVYAAPGAAGAKIAYKPSTTTSSAASSCPVKGQYFDVISPVNGKVYPGRPLHRRRHRTGTGCRRTRSRRLGQDRCRHTRQHPAENCRPHQQNLELLAYAETVDNGKGHPQTLNADIPSPSTTSATLRAACARRKAPCRTSTRTRWRTTSRNRWAWWARSFRWNFPS